MAKDHEALGVDLANLYDAGRYKLPVLAEQFDLAGTRLFHAGHGGAAFARHWQLGGHFGPAKAPWEALRDEILEILKQTASSMADSGAALVIAADAYAETDYRAAAEFDRIRDGLDHRYGGAS